MVKLEKWVLYASPESSSSYRISLFSRFEKACFFFLQATVGDDGQTPIRPLFIMASLVNNKLNHSLSKQMVKGR